MLQYCLKLQKEIPMAVLQSRVIALIDAALDYQHAFEELIRMIHKEDQNIRLGRQTPDGAILNLVVNADERILLEDPIRTKHTITSEHYHFKKNARRNIKEREYQAKRREQRGEIPSKTHFIPHYAKEEFSLLAQRTTAFRATGQNIRGNIPKTTYEPKDLSPESKWEIDNRPPSDLTPEEEDEFKAFLRRRDEEAQRKGKDPFEPSSEDE